MRFSEVFAGFGGVREAIGMPKSSIFRRFFGYFSMFLAATIGIRERVDLDIDLLFFFELRTLKNQCFASTGARFLANRVFAFEC